MWLRERSEECMAVYHSSGQCPRWVKSQRVQASCWPLERRILPLRCEYRSWVTSSSNSLGIPPVTVAYRVVAKRWANKNPGPQSRPGARMVRSEKISRSSGRLPGNRYRKQRCAWSGTSAFRCLLSRLPLRAIRVPLVRTGTSPRANAREIITQLGGRQYPCEK